MNRKPEKRGLTWFGNNRSGARNDPHAPYPPIAPKTPNTLGKMWRREPRGRGDTDAWLVGEPQAPAEPPPLQAGSEPYPNLAAWPQAPDRDRLGDHSATGERAAPIRTQPGIPNLLKGRLHLGRWRALWWKFAPPLRRPYLAVAVGVGAIALCSLLGVTALGAAFHGQPNTAQGTPGAGSANGAVVSPSAGQATPSVTTTATPGSTASPSPLTIAFTCASGTAGGTGQICIQTLPHAALSLSVRYCDGSYAKGKAFHGVDYADGSGNHTWRWNVNTSCLGAATATVTARAAGQTITQSTTFTVTR
ncbi:MAG TPA: hypothetical protein VFQ25_14185 [Ktedonobacterales bacterium]|nr:hypothetical protein [Ktedonobacterales bacterium]